MKRDRLHTVKNEINRLSAAIKDLETACPRPVFDRYNGSPHTAAVKRSSMDLTRALAVLRRGDYP